LQNVNDSTTTQIAVYFVFCNGTKAYNEDKDNGKKNQCIDRDKTQAHAKYTLY